MSEETLPCDQLLTPQEIAKSFSDFKMVSNLPTSVWQDGINTIPDPVFHQWVDHFISWCRQTNSKRALIVSHDGTITSYRQYLSGEQLTRDDFLGETGWHLVSI